MSRIDGAPPIVKNDCIFHDCLTVLNGAFADGNGLQFELGLNVMIDFCADSVELATASSGGTRWYSTRCTFSIDSASTPSNRQYQ